MRTVLVTLSGTHGSGKSTNAGKCYYLLNKNGFKFSYLRHQDLLDPFGFVLRRTARILHVRTSYLETTNPARTAWSVYILFIYLPLLVLGIRFRRMLGYSVVSDRYVYDMLVGFWDNQTTAPLQTLLVRILPRPDVSFMLDADEKRILADRPEHSLDYILNEKRQYNKIVGGFGLKRISTDEPPETVWNNILQEIQASFSQVNSGRKTVIGEQQ
jgi:thymidylate kinase